MYFGRAREPEDFIKPSRRGTRRHRVCRSSLTQLIQDCERTGVGARELLASPHAVQTDSGCENCT